MKNKFPNIPEDNSKQCKACNRTVADRVHWIRVNYPERNFPEYEIHERTGLINPKATTSVGRPVACLAATTRNVIICKMICDTIKIANARLCLTTHPLAGPPLTSDTRRPRDESPTGSNWIFPPRVYYTATLAPFHFILCDLTHSEWKGCVQPSFPSVNGCGRKKCSSRSLPTATFPFLS